ncbi:nitrogenase component 1 [Acetobacterium paludosum]|uniref:nitrogenase component 1 n=1 Tax=Acetobacterium paludosum TaxID=52693 RepID=UPI001478CE72|nr:nitrogenase component 1 [Acetobacterium paludosum]
MEKYFEESLQYYNPSASLVEEKAKTLIPESHELHVGPSACARRLSIGAYRRHDEDHITNLYITEEDIVSGSYEDIIPDAIEELLELLEKRPRVIILYVTCIDDLLGTDHEALLMLLKQRFSNIKFITCHIDPIAIDRSIKPGMKMQEQFYSVLDKSDCREKSINLIGNKLQLSNKSEFRNIINSVGWELKEMNSCKTFDEFNDMGKSSLNLVVAPFAKLAAESMKRDLDIPFLMTFSSYDLDTIEENYKKIFKAIEIEMPVLSDYRNRTVKKIKQTVEHLKNMPLVIDSSVIGRSIPLARALDKYGFNVKLVFDGTILFSDVEDLEWLKENRPDIKIADGRNFNMMNMKNSLGDCLCIGFSSGYTLEAKHVVERLPSCFAFGYYGVELLMDRMIQAYDTVADYEKIQEQSEAW